MASGVNVKMGVTGVAQFKQNMTTAQNSVKTMNAQLNLIEKQFKATGDSETYMQQKSELLKAKREEQKSVAANAEKALQQMTQNGVDKASKAFQDMQQQLLKAKADMLDTETGIENIGVAAVDTGVEVIGMNEQLQKVGQGISYQNVTDALGSITDGMEKVIKTAGRAAAAVINATLQGGSWADKLGEKAEEYEISPEELYRMQQTAKIIDTDADTILAARDKLNKNIGSGNKNALEDMINLNVHPYGNPDDVFWEVGEALMNMEDKTKQAAYANDIFGKSWREMVPLFKAGREEYEDTMKAWSWVGDENFEKLTKMDDEFQKMTSEWEAFQLKFEAAMAPALTAGMEVLEGLLKEFNEFLSKPEGQEMLEAMGEAVKGLFTDLSQIDPKEVMKGLTEVFDKITTGLKWIGEHRNSIVHAVYAFIGAFATLKTAEGVTTVLKLIDGIKGLGGAGGAAAAGTAAGTSWGTAFAAAVAKAAPWLIGLYTLLNPASTAGEQLDSLWDANGNPTQAAIDAGITQTESEYNSGVLSDKERQEQEEAVRRKTESLFVGNTEESTARNERILNSMHRLEELVEGNGSESSGGNSFWTGLVGGTMNKINSMPKQVADAVLKALTGTKVEMEAETVGRIITPYVAAGMGDMVFMVTK